MAKRKLWATDFPSIGVPKRRHETKVATYRYVQAEAANWDAGALRSQFLNVYVDERDGQGWQTYERINLADLGNPA